jgi:hypothetical protein
MNGGCVEPLHRIVPLKDSEERFASGLLGVVARLGTEGMTSST